MRDSWYVRATRAMFRTRTPLTIAAVNGTIDITIDRDGTIRARYRFEFDAATSARLARPTERPRTLLSLVVTSQDAHEMPHDLVVRICGAPRPFIVRERMCIDRMAEELVTDGVAYVDDVTNTFFCSLDAAHFSDDAVPLESRRPEWVYLPRTYTYTPLLQHVVRAQDRERQLAPNRHCHMPSTAPLVGSQFVAFEPDAMRAAIEYIDTTLVPHTRRVFDATTMNIVVIPFDFAAWDILEMPLPTEYRAQLTVTCTFVIE